MSDSNEASEGSPRRLGSYTTARVTRGRVERVERHAGRLRRDAARLGLPEPARVEIERTLLETARQAFGRGDGIVRIEWSCLPGEAPELIATSRPLEAASAPWRVACSKTTHPGREARAGTKHVDVEAYARARAELREAGLDEVLLFDAAGRLVEGARSNLLVVTSDDRVLTPDLSLGGVEGLGLEIVLENHPEIRFATIRLEELEVARELMAVNAVRGVVPVVELDGKPVGAGVPGPWSDRLGAPLHRPGERRSIEPTRRSR